MTYLSVAPIYLYKNYECLKIQQKLILRNLGCIKVNLKSSSRVIFINCLNSTRMTQETLLHLDYDAFHFQFSNHITFAYLQTLCN